MNMKYLKWLVKVRQELMKVNYLSHKNGVAYRKFLFTKKIKMDVHSWLSYYDEGLTPVQAVREDLGLPIIEFRPHTIVY